MPILGVVLGANLDMLGKRDAGHYGSLTLDEIKDKLQERATQLHCEVEVVQSNSEAELIDWVHAGADRFEGFLVNPGGFTRFGQALCDAFVDTGKPWIEVHMSNILARHMTSIWSEKSLGQIAGFHWRSYTAGLEILDGIVRDASAKG
jgi:3-dehydroquinate dehydratase II